jgi:hypothetical protein
MANTNTYHDSYLFIFLQIYFPSYQNYIMDNTLLVGCLEDENIFENFRVENNYILQEYNPDTCQLFKINSKGELMEVNDYSAFKFHDLRTNTMYKCEKKEKYYRHIVISTDIVKIYGRDVVLDDYKITSRGLELKYNYEIVQTITEKDGFIIVIVNESYLLFKVKGHDKVWSRVITGNRFIFKDLSTDKRFTYLVDGSSIQLLDVVNPLKQSMVLKFVEGNMNIGDSYNNFLNSTTRVHLLDMNADQEILIPQPNNGAVLEYSYNTDCKFDGQWKVSLADKQNGSITFQSMEKGKLIIESYYLSKKVITKQTSVSEFLTHTITDNSYFVYDGKQHRLYVQDSKDISEGQKIKMTINSEQVCMTVNEKKGNVLIVSGDNLPQQNLFSSDSITVQSIGDDEPVISHVQNIPQLFSHNITIHGDGTSVDSCSDITSLCSNSKIYHCDAGLSMGDHNSISSNGHIVSGNSTASIGDRLITLGDAIINYGQKNILKGNDLDLSGYQTTYELNNNVLNLLAVEESAYAMLGRFGSIIIEHQGRHYQAKVRMPLPGLVMTSEGKHTIYNLFLESKLDDIPQATGRVWISCNQNNFIQGDSIKATGNYNIVHGTGHILNGKNCLVSGSNNTYLGSYFFKAVQKKDVFTINYQEFKQNFDLKVGDQLIMNPNIVNSETITCIVSHVGRRNGLITFTVDKPTISNVYYFIEVFRENSLISGTQNISTNSNMTVGDQNINRSENCLLVGSSNRSFGKLHDVGYSEYDSKYIVDTNILLEEGKVIVVSDNRLIECSYNSGMLMEDGFHFRLDIEQIPDKCAFVEQEGQSSLALGDHNSVADNSLCIGKHNHALSNSLVVGFNNLAIHQNSICIGQSVQDMADNSLNIGSDIRQTRWLSGTIHNNKIMFGNSDRLTFHPDTMYRLSFKIMIKSEEDIHFLDYDKFSAHFSDDKITLSSDDLVFSSTDAKLIVSRYDNDLSFHIDHERQWKGMINLQIDSLKC